MKLKELYPILKGDCSLLVIKDNTCYSFELNEKSFNMFSEGKVVEIESRSIDADIVYTSIEVHI